MGEQGARGEEGWVGRREAGKGQQRASFAVQLGPGIGDFRE